jgi:homeobox protein HoxA/B/D1
MMMMNIGMYGMCNTTDTFSSYHEAGSTSNHHNHHNSHHLHHHGASVIHHYNSSSEIAPSYSSATATTPPEHHFHHHPVSYYATQLSVDTYDPSPSAGNQGLHGNEVCNNAQRSPPLTVSQTNENICPTPASYYNTNSGALHQHQHQHHAQDTSQGPPQQHDGNVIITSDNGLSYTNLDYGTPNTQATYHHPHHHNTMTPPSLSADHHPVLYPSTAINYVNKNHHHHEEMVHQESHQHEEMLSHHASHHQQHQQEGYSVSGSHYMHHSTTSPDTPETAQYSPVLNQHHQSPSPISAEYHALHHRHYKEEPCHQLLSEMHQHQIHSASTAVGAGNGAVMMATPAGAGNFHHHSLHHHHMHHQTPGHHHHHHHLSQQQQQQQQQTAAVPTYKWMQVKRNVPKPAGKDFS